MRAVDNWKEEALAKLEREYKDGKYDRYGEAMKSAVRDALADFCRQDDEFAQAVAQGGSFSECMKAVAKNCGQSMSDLEAYRRAAAFYFKGSDVVFRMEIRLVSERTEKAKPVILNLMDFV